jgi:polysaccharide export outer membrane protein
METNGAYRLDSGDRVRVVVAGQDALSNSYEVDAGGAIEMSLIGRVSARGLNAIQLSGAIERRLKQSNVREAHVAVQIETYRPITIRGEVANPGQYPYVNNMTTETAIEMAGGLRPSADKRKVKINGGEPEPAAPVSSSADSPVRPGDTVVVPEER